MNAIWMYYICHHHVNYQHQLCHLSAIDKSSPIVSWDSKGSFGCTLKNLTGSRRSSGDYPLFYQYWTFRHTTLYTYCFGMVYYSKVFNFKYYLLYKDDTYPHLLVKGHTLWTLLNQADLMWGTNSCTYLRWSPKFF